MEADNGTESALTAGVDYARRGWLVVPVHGIDEHGACTCGSANCKPRGKHPIFSGWQDSATKDEAEVERLAETWPSANIGVKLGPDSGIIDVEFDGDEGRAAADKLLAECFTPTFSSGRSVHRLFKWSDALPQKQKVLVAGLEVRIGGDSKGTQSVFPPSRHHSGKRYEWLPGLSPDDVDVQDVPPALLALVWNDPGCASLASGGNGKAPRSKEHWDKIFPGVADGEGRTDSAVSLAGKLLRGLADVESTDSLSGIWQLFAAWNNGNRPPLDEGKLKDIFASILRKERSRRAAEDLHAVFPLAAAEHVAEVANEAEGANKSPDLGKRKDAASSRLVIVKSDPPLCRVYSDRFAAAGGAIEIPLRDLISPGIVQRHALEQARYVMPKLTQKKWEEHIRGLLETAEIVTPPPESTKAGILGAKILGALASTQADDQGGRAMSYRAIRLRVSAGEPTLVSHRDLGLFLESLGGERRRKENSREWYFSLSAIKNLEKLAGLG